MSKPMSIDQVQIAATSVGNKYQKRFAQQQRESTDNNDTPPPACPWLDDNPHWHACLRDNQWTRWDGLTTGTAQEHALWMQQQAQSLFSKDRAPEFRPYGKHDGCRYYVHDEMTAAGDGFGLFKIEGRVFNVEPVDVLRLCFDMEQIMELDPTCVFYRMEKPYPIPAPSSAKDDDETTFSSFVAPVYWSNDPGFPFYVRDSIDLTGFVKDKTDENVVWQVATGVQVPGFQSQPGGAVKATDRYWAYRLEKVGPNQTKISLLCQSCLYGWIPRFLSNYFVCRVLIDSLGNMEKTIAKLKASDPEGYQVACAKMGLGGA